MAIDPEPGKLNLDAPVFASELTQAEFRAALRDMRSKMILRRPLLPTIGDILRNRENTKGAK